MVPIVPVPVTPLAQIAVIVTPINGLFPPSNEIELYAVDEELPGPHATSVTAAITDNETAARLYLARLSNAFNLISPKKIWRTRITYRHEFCENFDKIQQTLCHTLTIPTAPIVVFWIININLL